ATPNRQRVQFDSAVAATSAPTAPPVYDSTPVTTGAAGQAYSYQAKAHDPAGLTLAYVLYSGPDGMTVDRQTGLLTWAPTAKSPADAKVVLQVYNSRGAHATQDFTVQVQGGNHPPAFAGLPRVIRRAEGQALVLPVQTADADNNRLTFWAEHLPPGAAFDPQSHTLTWIPDYKSAGTYNATFFVSDGAAQVSATVTLLISPAKAPPVLAAVPDRTLREGETLRFT